VNSALDLLLSDVYPGSLAPEHRADLRKSGLRDDTIAQHKIMSVPPGMIDRLLGFSSPKAHSACLFPFPDPTGRWLPHIRMKVFPEYQDRRGRTVKYLGPPAASPRVYFPIPTMPAVLSGDAALWVVEGCKKALTVAQLTLPVVAIEGIEGWHCHGSLDVLPDFDVIPLTGRIIELLPDGDVRTNPNVRRGAEALALALARRGGRPRLVSLPEAA
jgi:hypothetical protein